MSRLLIHRLSVYDTYCYLYLQHPFTSGKFINMKANGIAPPNTASERRSLEWWYVCIILTLILL